MTETTNDLHKQMVSSRRRRLRIRQIGITSRLFNSINEYGVGRAITTRIGDKRSTKNLLRYLLGYNITFATMPEARAAIEPYADEGHENLATIDHHFLLNERPRPSDYAVLFHFLKEIDSIKSVFDVGGNAGNLFYCYDEALQFGSEFSWTVYDLPLLRSNGELIANKRGERRLRFTGEWQLASGCDVLLISGSLHYFPTMSRLIEELPEKPRMIMINRVPLTDGASVAVIQDYGHNRVACMLYNRDELVRQICEIGYELVSAWEAAELKLLVPSNPEYNVHSYSGFFFKLKTS